MRATRDLLRRRTPLMRKRAELLAPVQNTPGQDHLPELGQQLADQANREGVAARCADPAVHKTLAVDLALLTAEDERLQDLALSRLKPAKHPEAHPRYLLHTMPASGKLLSLVLRYELHAIDRFPPGQEFVSYGRLVKWAKASAGTRLGTAGKNMGNAHLQWAFSAAAALCLRHNPAGQPELARLETQHEKGKAVTLLAHKLARAVSSMLKRHTAFDRAPFLHGSGSSAGEPGASRDPPGLSLSRAGTPSCGTASLNAKVRRGLFSQSPGR